MDVWCVVTDEEIFIEVLADLAMTSEIEDDHMYDLHQWAAKHNVKKYKVYASADGVFIAFEELADTIEFKFTWKWIDVATQVQ